MTKAGAPPLKPGDDVHTPSGAHAEVIAVYPDEDEALVQWTSGDRARFKLGLLRRAAKPKEATP